MVIAYYQIGAAMNLKLLGEMAHYLIYLQSTRINTGIKFVNPPTDTQDIHVKNKR